MTTNIKPTPTEFLRRFVGDTASLLSGGLSVPSTVLALYFDNKYARVSFAMLAVAGVLIASYRLWAGERRNTLALQDRLAEEINKRARPEVTVELKEGNSGSLHACLMNYTSTAAINLRIDDIPVRLGTLRFENIPTMISSGFSPTLECYFEPWDGSAKRRDIVQELIFDAEKSSDVSKHVLAIRYTDSDGVLDWVTKCDFGYDFKQKKIVLLKQRIEEGEAESALRKLQKYSQGATPDQRTIPPAMASHVQEANPHMEQHQHLHLEGLLERAAKAVPSPPPPKAPQKPPEPNLVLIPGVKMGKLYLVGDHWYRTPLSGYARPDEHTALWIEIKNRADDRIVGPVNEVRAELIVGEDEYSPLFWLDHEYNLVEFEFGESNYVLLAVEMGDGDRGRGDWRIPINRRDYDHPSGLNALDLDNFVKVTMKDARTRLNLLHVSGGTVLRSYQGKANWRQDRPWFEFN